MKVTNDYLISIIIPIYNVEKYLADCLESVLAQKIDDYEIICVEDCSTDNSREVLEEYKRNYPQIKVIQNKKNLGLSYSRNVGINHAKGTYILFLDSDDMISKKFFEEIEEVCKKGIYDLIGFSLAVHSEEMSEKYKYALNDRKAFSLKYNGYEAFNTLIENKDLIIAVMTRLYRREYILEEELLFIDGILHEDLPFTFKALLQAKSVKLINKAYYKYRRRSNSITTKKANSDNIKGRYIGYLDSLAFWENLKLDDRTNECVKMYFEKYYLKDIFSTINKYNIRNIIFEDVIIQYKWDHLNYWKNGREIDFEKLEGNKRVLIYGAGTYGKMLMTDLINTNINVVGFAVTKDVDEDVVMTHEVKNIDAYSNLNKDETVVVIAISHRYQAEIKDCLIQRGFESILTIDDIYIYGY